MCFKLTQDSELFLIPEMQVPGVHIVGLGKKEDIYGELLERFVRSHQVKSIDKTPTSFTTAKTYSHGKHERSTSGAEIVRF